MYNAITAYKSRLEGECTCKQDVARFLMEIVELPGRVIKSYGQIWDTFWMMIDEGLLLFTEPDDVFATSHATTAHLVWVADVTGEDSFPIHQFSGYVSLDDEHFCFDRLRTSTIREVGLRVERVISLRNDSGLHAYPPNEVPPSDSLDGFRSEGLQAFGLIFSQSVVTGYLSLENFHLFIQGPDWRYSDHPWFKMEPRLAMNPYGYYVLFASTDNAKVLSIDGSEKRFCLFTDGFLWSWEFRAMNYLIHEAIDTYDSEYQPYYNCRESVDPSLKIWRAILAHSDWKSLYKELLKDTYEISSPYTSWPKFCKEFEQADYLEVRESLQYLYDWVSTALDAAGGVYAYCIM